MNQKKTPPRPDFDEETTARRRDDAIRRALRTPPTHLKDMKKKGKPRPPGPSSNKRGGA